MCVCVRARRGVDCHVKMKYRKTRCSLIQDIAGLSSRALPPVAAHSSGAPAPRFAGCNSRLRLAGRSRAQRRRPLLQLVLQQWWHWCRWIVVSLLKCDARLSSGAAGVGRRTDSRQERSPPSPPRQTKILWTSVGTHGCTLECLDQHASLLPGNDARRIRPSPLHERHPHGLGGDTGGERAMAHTYFNEPLREFIAILWVHVRPWQWLAVIDRQLEPLQHFRRLFANARSLLKERARPI